MDPAWSVPSGDFITASTSTTRNSLWEYEKNQKQEEEEEVEEEEQVEKLVGKSIDSFLVADAHVLVKLDYDCCCCYYYYCCRERKKRGFINTRDHSVTF